MKYLLILVLWNTNGGIESSTTVFQSLTACQTANKVVSQIRTSSSIHIQGFCVPEGRM